MFIYLAENGLSGMVCECVSYWEKSVERKNSWDVILWKQKANVISRGGYNQVQKEDGRWKMEMETEEKEGREDQCLIRSIQ